MKITDKNVAEDNTERQRTAILAKNTNLGDNYAVVSGTGMNLCAFQAVEEEDFTDRRGGRGGRGGGRGGRGGNQGDRQPRNQGRGQRNKGGKVFKADEFPSL